MYRNTHACNTVETRATPPSPLADSAATRGPRVCCARRGGSAAAAGDAERIRVAAESDAAVAVAVAVDAGDVVVRVACFRPHAQTVRVAYFERPAGRGGGAKALPTLSIEVRADCAAQLHAPVAAAELPLGDVYTYEVFGGWAGAAVAVRFAFAVVLLGSLLARGRDPRHARVSRAAADLAVVLAQPTSEVGRRAYVRARPLRRAAGRRRCHEKIAAPSAVGRVGGAAARGRRHGVHGEESAALLR